MDRYHERYRLLILVAAFCGLYFSPIEKIIKNKFELAVLKLFALASMFFLPLYVIDKFILIVYDQGDIMLKFFSLGIIVIFTLPNITSLFFYLKRNEYVRLLESWDDLFEEDFFPEERKKFLRENNRKIERILKTFTVLSLLSVFVYATLSASNKNKSLSHPSGIPYRNQSPDFELMVIYDILVGYFSYTGSMVFDLLMMVFFSLEEGQLMHLKMSLGRIFEILQVDESGKTMAKTNCGMQDVTRKRFQRQEVRNELEEKIRIWIKQHQRVLWLHGEVQKVYGTVLSLKIIIFATFLCLSCFLSATGYLKTNDTFAAITICMTLFSIFFLNIKISDSLTEAGRSIFDESFGKSWHLHSKHAKSSMRIIVMRAHRTLPVMTLKIYPFDSTTFLKVLYTAYSIFTFLQQVTRKRNILNNQN